MKKAGLIIFMLLVVSCSASKRAIRTESTRIAGEGESFTYSNIERNNIGNKGIYIRKADIEIESAGLIESFTANLRISTKGVWLLSIRSFAGIEVARVLADSAGVTVLDRIGRIATIYDWNKINKNFGLSYSMLKMIIGDVPGITGSDMIRLLCRDTYKYMGKTGDFSLVVDCDIFKPSFIRLHDHDVSISYYDYINERGYFFPGMIAIESARLGSSVKISATDIEIPWYGEASIAIPSNYKIVK